MTKRRVIIEMRATPALWQAASQPFAQAAEALPSLPGIALDTSFAPVPLPALLERRGGDEPAERTDRLTLGLRPEQATYLVRGEIDDEAPAVAAAAQPPVHPDVVGIFADVQIEPFGVCPGSPPVGDDHDVERALGVAELHRRGMDGRDVLVAIVDTGINLAHLQAKGKNPSLDASRSWSPISGGHDPGEWPTNHGTMCAFDVCIAAPRCTLLDIALLQSTAGPFPAFLSEAVRAYQHLLGLMTGFGRPSLVVNNSWGMFHPSWDYPVGHPGNYSDNPNHPFNRIVGALERAGADILFAAGNCGRDCPDGRCQGVTNQALYGASSHPQVLSVAGADVTRVRAGYSSIGPGRLTREKPDVTGYTHFAGSGVYPADGGTSAATPVVAGVVAAVRTVRPFRRLRPATWPSAIRSLLRRTAIDLGQTGYDFEYGYGIVDGEAVARHARIPLVGAEPDDETADDEVPTAGPVAAFAATWPAAEQAAGGKVAGWQVTAQAADAAAPKQAARLALPPRVAAAAGVQHFFGRIAPDAGPGLNTLTITGLPAGTRGISAWITEWVQPNNPHAGGARFDTISVQLFDNGQQCRVVYNLQWGRSLPAAVQGLFGP